MKKGKYILLGICLAFLCLVVGVFIGRNSNHLYKMELPILETTVPNINIQSDISLNINEMSKVQLMALPGIGETLAERIIAYRNEYGYFKDIEDLLMVEGIGEKKLEQIIDLVGIGG